MHKLTPATFLRILTAKNALFSNLFTTVTTEQEHLMMRFAVLCHNYFFYIDLIPSKHRPILQVPSKYKGNLYTGDECHSFMHVDGDVAWSGKAWVFCSLDMITTNNTLFLVCWITAGLELAIYLLRKHVQNLKSYFMHTDLLTCLCVLVFL